MKVIRDLLGSADLLSVETEINKTTQAVGILLRAAMTLNVEATMRIDENTNGHPCFPDREQGTTYHTQQSWKEKG